MEFGPISHSASSLKNLPAGVRVETTVHLASQAPELVRLPASFGPAKPSMFVELCE
jgi:hypothetical protein